MLFATSVLCCLITSLEEESDFFLFACCVIVCSFSLWSRAFELATVYDCVTPWTFRKVFSKITRLTNIIMFNLFTGIFTYK